MSAPSLALKHIREVQMTPRPRSKPRYIYLRLTTAERDALIAAAIGAVEDYAASGEEAPENLLTAIGKLRQSQRFLSNPKEAGE